MRVSVANAPPTQRSAPNPFPAVTRCSLTRTSAK
uniref:Uncharacterized protein n=1 Tax=Human herpesvirus 1 TaxID=10298 RepID=A0A2Z4H381_HHV1|nr:hypothetical protein [Human alphaherpesvirus 1]AWW09965.1 hypothetical protein [Human alphaherpesvirus 1]